MASDSHKVTSISDQKYFFSIFLRRDKQTHKRTPLKQYLFHYQIITTTFSS